MSLVNDALKRAQHLQQKQQDLPPPPHSDSAPPHTPNSGLWLPFLATALAVLGIAILIVFWKFSPDGRPPGTHASPPLNLTPQPREQTALGRIPPVVPATPQPPIAATPQPAALPPAVIPTPSPPPSQLPSYKLQAIFYTPGNPSAIINGKTVQIGDTLDDSRVLAITPDGVDLATRTRTNHITPKGVSPHY